MGLWLQLYVEKQFIKWKKKAPCTVVSQEYDADSLEPITTDVLEKNAIFKQCFLFPTS